ncbi:YbcC family protein [Devosia sp.]|uniref:YbcC family protein n=1 Tax=Devosia sp. TaxID=1871048 RepID=UPI003BAA2FFD
MSHVDISSEPQAHQIRLAADRAAGAIPPAWPLASSVAVNPFLGQTDEPLSQVAARLARVAGASVTMPRSWYRDQIAKGTINEQDLSDALARAPLGLGPESLASLKSQLQTPARPLVATMTVADLAAKVSGIDWPGLINERFGAWAAGYLDEGQALWAAPRGRSAYAAWRLVAMHDLTPEIVGLSGFATHVAEAPEGAVQALERATARLGLPDAALETYFHQLLIGLGGWAQYARYLLWQAELKGGTDATVGDFLAIRMLWEEVLWDRYGDQILADWGAVVAVHAAPLKPAADQVVDALLQEAAERAAQRALADTLAAPSAGARESRPAIQAAFCIDVRSEVFRRALESLNPEIQTLGFAGFFGMSASHRRFASDVEEHRLPVLLNSGLSSVAGDRGMAGTDRSTRVKERAKRAWGRFKLAAVSSFAFVEATGPIYASKLVGDALGLKGARLATDPAPQLVPRPDLPTRIKTAATVLRAMSLTSNFARLVVLAGHGANVVNNPHASALHCGACGGYAGDVNSRLLAVLLNDGEVRSGLVGEGIEVPADTLFVAALHDTTTDTVTLFDEDHQSPSHGPDLAVAQDWFASAGLIARSERALRLPHATEETILRRSRDWAEIRPEWALAGCNAFIGAPRRFTSGKNLQGRAFLHDYDWRADSGFKVLELIMTAPVVVASWISLQYYGSTVAPALFGGGNKLLHNVVGGMGVLEGNGGAMRAGLPWQSVHDGEQFVHEPLRLSVCIAAPCEAMTEILGKHAGVRALFDNRWLHLFALDEAGRMAWRYGGDLNWTPMAASAESDTELRAAV